MPATSPALNPSRTNSIRIAKSRRPVARRRSQLASNFRTCDGSSDRGNPATRQLATDGTAVASGCASSPSICRKLSSERSAGTISFAVPRGRLRHSTSTKSVTSRGANPKRSMRTTSFVPSRTGEPSRCSNGWSNWPAPAQLSGKCDTFPEPPQAPSVPSPVGAARHPRFAEILAAAPAPSVFCSSCNRWLGEFITIIVGTLGISGGTVRPSRLLVRLHRGRVRGLARCSVGAAYLFLPVSCGSTRKVKILMLLPDGRNVATRQAVHGSAP